MKRKLKPLTYRERQFVDALPLTTPPFTGIRYGGLSACTKIQWYGENGTCALFDDGPGMLLRAVTIIAATIVHASRPRGDGLESHFEERGTGLACMDTNNPSIETPF